MPIDFERAPQHTQGLSETVTRLIDRFIPPPLREEREELLRSRLFVGTCLAIMTSCVVLFPALLFWNDGGWLIPTLTGLSLIAFVFQLALFWHFKSPTFSGILVTLQFTANVLIFSAMTGGNLSPVLFWDVIIILLAMIMVGLWWGVICTIFSMSKVLLFAVLSYQKISLITAPISSHNLSVVITGLSFFALIGFLGWLYNNTRRHAEEALTSSLMSMKKMEVAKDAALLANRSKSEFLATMSHELRTPLNAIIGYAEILQEEADDLNCTEIIPDLDKIRGAGEHLLNLINDILDLSKIEAGKMEFKAESFSLPELAEEISHTIQPLINKKNNQLQVDLDERLEEVTIDRIKLRQCVFNLLSNATKFTERGKITWRITYDDETYPVPMMVHEVEDTGIGMSKEQLEKLFRMFQQGDASHTRKYGGTGLGLAITKKLSQLMGGDITATSIEKQGSTFKMWLPIAQQPTSFDNLPEVLLKASNTIPQKQSTGPVSLQGPKGKKRVLAIDDDPQVLELLSRVLTREGYEVELASSGEEGLSLAETSQPDLITLDVMMPSLDGWSVLSKLKTNQATRHIPVVMVTIVDDRKKGMALGAAEVLTKPIDREELLATLEKHSPTDQKGPILIVEDDPESRELLQRILKKEGWNTREANNGLQALEQMNLIQPQLILLDLMMPELDGFQFLAALKEREEHADIPVIVMTAKLLTDGEREKLQHQVQEIVQKAGIDTKQLIAQIAHHIEQTG